MRCPLPKRKPSLELTDSEDFSRRAVLALCCYCMFTGAAIVAVAATSLSAISVDLGMATDAAKGLFLSANFWGVGAVMLFSGMLGERLGLRRLLLLSASLQFAGLWSVAFATDLYEAVAATALAGVGRGMVAAPMTALLCSLYPERRTLVTSLLHGFFYVGMIFILAGLIVLYEWDLGWRSTYRVMAVFVFSYGVAGLFVRSPRGVGAPERGRRMPMKDLFRQPTFLLLSAAMVFSGILESGPLNWVPYFIEQAAGASRNVAIVGMLLVGLAMSIGRLSFGLVAKRLESNRYFLISGLVCAGSLVLSSLPVGTAFTIFWLLVLGLALAGYFPAILVGCADRFPDAGPSMIAFLTMLAVIGALFGPLCMGVAADAFGLRSAMASQAVVPLALIVIMVLFRRSGT